MRTYQQIFFGNFGGPQQEQVKSSSEDLDYLYNTLILEIANNWPWVRWLMDRFRNNDLKEEDILERNWLSFISENNIDVEKYGKDSDQFIKDWFKNRENKNE